MTLESLWYSTGTVVTMVTARVYGRWIAAPDQEFINQTRRHFPPTSGTGNYVMLYPVYLPVLDLDSSILLLLIEI